MIFFEVPIEFSETVLDSEGMEISYRDMSSPYPMNILEYIKRGSLTYDPAFFRIISREDDISTIYQFNTTSGFDSVRRLDYTPSSLRLEGEVYIREPHPNLHWFLLNVDMGDVEGQPTMKILSRVKYPDYEFLSKVLQRLKKFYPNQWTDILKLYFPGEDIEDVVDMWLSRGLIVQDTISNITSSYQLCLYLTLKL